MGKRSTARYPTCTLPSDMGTLVNFQRPSECLETWTQQVSRLSSMMVSFALCFLDDCRGIRARSTILDSVGKVNRIDGLPFAVTQRLYRPLAYLWHRLTKVQYNLAKYRALSVGASSLQLHILQD